MKKIQKAFTLAAIVSMVIVVIMLLLSLFDIEVFEDTLLAVLLTFATISVALFFSISSMTMYRKNKVISIICMALLGVSLICGLIIYWNDFKMPEGFNKATGIIAVATVFFIIIISTNLKLMGHYKILQTICFGIIVMIDVVITLQIVEIDVLDNETFSKFFIAFCLIAFALLCTINILAKKVKDVDNDIIENHYVKIKETEYKALLNKVKTLEEENVKLRSLIK